MADHCCKHEAHASCRPPLASATRKDAARHEAVDTCCSGGVPVFDGMDPLYKRVLWTVIGINGAMFLTEMVAGQLAGSQALGRRARLPRRYRNLRPKPGCDRRVLAGTGNGGPV